MSVNYFHQVESFTCNFLYGNSPKYAAGTAIGAVIVGRFKWRGITAEDSVQETTGLPRLGDCLTDGQSLSMFL